MSGTQVSSGSVKVTIEEADDLSEFRAEIDGQPVTGIDVFCADPLPPGTRLISISRHLAAGNMCCRSIWKKNAWKVGSRNCRSEFVDLLSESDSYSHCCY